MSRIRRSLRPLAALVLLVWLFASGVAFAQACLQTSEMALCEECCTEAQPVAQRADADTRLPAPAAVPLPPAVVAWTPALLEQGTRATHAPAGGWLPPPEIPIVFLRLTL
ncbi:hypothetical protein [Ramlibacter sp.]|uniref:hypothetical protein n=1 Tax=Ramlibacter sp. TaxID=1917967 RepID=UPI002FC87289